MARSSNARENMVRAAIRLFPEKGYNGVGLTELLAVSHAPKGSFYHHFPEGKEELAAEMVKAAGVEIGNLIDTCFAAAMSERDAVERLATTIGLHFEQSHFRAGCPIASVAQDAVPQSGRLTGATQAVLADWKHRVLRHIDRWGRTGQLADEFADRLAIALEGAWMIARIKQSSEPFRHVSHMIGEA